MRLRLEDVNSSDRDDTREEELDPYQTVAVRTMLDWDHRDDVIWPTRGFRVAGGIETGYADGALLKFLHSFGYYRRLYGDLIWAYEHDLGIMPYDHDQVRDHGTVLPGRPSDVRGFRARGASPVDPGYDRLRVGGSTKLAQRNELRFPIVGPLKGRVFVYNGFIDKKPWNFLHPRASTGAGFVVDLRVVNVEIDLAKAVVRTPPSQIGGLFGATRAEFLIVIPHRTTMFVLYENMSIQGGVSYSGLAPNCPSAGSN